MIDLKEVLDSDLHKYVVESIDFVVRYEDRYASLSDVRYQRVGRNVFEGLP